MITKKRLRPYVAVAVSIFFIAILSGYSTAVNSPENSRMIVKGFFDHLDFAKDFNSFSIFIFIFLNNSLKAFLVILFGFFFAIAPLAFIYANGELIGLIAGVFHNENNLAIIVLGLLPHGILEIPAMVLSTSYGIWLGNCFYRRLRYREPFRVNFYFALERFFKIIIPMLFLAAVIESFVTPIVIDYLFSH